MAQEDPPETHKGYESSRALKEVAKGQIRSKWTGFSQSGWLLR